MTCPLGGEFDPAVADCGYRAPLTPRLARSRSFYPPISRSLTALRRRLARWPEAQERPGTEPADKRPERHRQREIETKRQEQGAKVRRRLFLRRSHPMERCRANR